MKCNKRRGRDISLVTGMNCNSSLRLIHTQSRTFLVEQLSTPITAYHCLLDFDKDLSESDELYLDFDEDLLEPDDPDKGLSDAGTDEDFY